MSEKPWPQSKTANVGEVFGPKIIGGKSKTSSETISKICDMMDQIESKLEKAKKGGYKLPELPPTGMRFNSPQTRQEKVKALRGSLRFIRD